MSNKVKKNSLIKQHDITDCGAACLASVAAYYNLQLPIAQIRQFASTNQRGTNVLGIVEAGQRLGFQCKGVKGPKESLPKIPKPAIAHVIVKERLHHFVVIYESTETEVTVMDPADGKLHKKDVDSFVKEWTGYLIILLPDEYFKQET